jgi:hypothetical protein
MRSNGPSPAQLRHYAASLRVIMIDLREMAAAKSFEEYRPYLEYLPARLVRLANQLEGRDIDEDYWGVDAEEGC